MAAFANVEPVTSVEALEARFFELQYVYLPVSPPSEPVFVQPAEVVVPVDWSGFPKSFLKGMVAQMDENGFPIYVVTVREDPLTRDTVFENAYGTEVYRIKPPIIASAIKHWDMS